MEHWPEIKSRGLAPISVFKVFLVTTVITSILMTGFYFLLKDQLGSYKTLVVQEYSEK